MASRASSANAYLLVPIVLMAALLGTAVIRGPNLITESGIGSAVIVAAPVILATYALMVLAVAGRGTVDLAVGPLLAFINVVLVKLSTAGILASPIATFIVAIGLGMLYQLLFALIVIWVRVQPIIVALSGFLALTGINLVILPRPGGVAPEFMMGWGAGTTIFSPVLVILVVATLSWYLFTASTFYTNLKMMGYDERAAWTSGIRTDVVRIGAHLIAGVYVGLGAICYTALISSGDPTQGQNMTLTAITALVLGGVALSGGRGGVTGALLGAVSLWLIGYVLATFNFGAIQAFMTQMVYGIILVLSLLLTLLVPVIARYVSFISPWSAFLVLGVIVLSIMMQVGTFDTYAEVAPVAVEAATSERYFLIEPARVATDGFQISAVQAFALIAGLGAIAIVLAARLVDAESGARRMGPFLYLFVAVMLIALFVAIIVQPDSSLFGVPK
ncbi:ABC transporter permease [Roseovarius indicus]|uniref:Ribose transport system permease protein RbsC n=1 Tax=Roseovarius indicus TaxID=540747 RepID=A0A5P3AEJ2_9RHOB|nr:ABC transporter permease [Roseovarius indicus]QEW27762.1 Ribose transport system permease protein RbsC [Roseovarius indicus]SFE31460.1 ribose transport system permease protein [Roseovarius indicus]